MKFKVVQKLISKIITQTLGRNLVLSMNAGSVCTSQCIRIYDSYKSNATSVLQKCHYMKLDINAIVFSFPTPRLTQI
jgi:hypothetical protein